MSRQKRNPRERILLCNRFIEALSLLGLNPLTGYKVLGYSNPSTLYSVAAGRCLPDVIKLIELSRISTASGYRVNLDWLITGNGKKLVLISDKIISNTKLEMLLANCPKNKIDALFTILN